MVNMTTSGDGDDRDLRFFASSYSSINGRWPHPLHTSALSALEWLSLYVAV